MRAKNMHMEQTKRIKVKERTNDWIQICKQRKMEEMIHWSILRVIPMVIKHLIKLLDWIQLVKMTLICIKAIINMMKN